MCDNLENCCRICLDNTLDHIEIFQDPNVEMHIRSCLIINLSANDLLPKVICIECASLLKDFYNLQLNARCSQDWLESCLQEKNKKNDSNTVQPLPESEYNSDSLLEFLNNTTHIEEYINNLGKDDIPIIVNMLDRNVETQVPKLKTPSPRKKEPVIKLKKTAMKVDVLESDFEIVKDILMRECDFKISKNEKEIGCYGCHKKFDTSNSMLEHTIICDLAIRTCQKCYQTFESRNQMLTHLQDHITLPATCECGKVFKNKTTIIRHYKVCPSNRHLSGVKYTYSCKECGLVFNDRLKLFKHVKKHLPKFKICNICGVKCNGESDLNNHKAALHEAENNVEYRCKICMFKSSSKPELYSHVQTHLTTPIITETVLNLLCESCGKSFNNKMSLWRHKYKHKKEGSHKIIDKRKKQEKLKEMAICEHCGLVIDCDKFSSHQCLNKVL